MATATTSQINFIKNLLADKAHTDNGKTILVGETRFRTTAEKIDTISSTVASRLITALKDAPKKTLEERTPDAPHFRHLNDRWYIMGLEDGKTGDIIEVATKTGDTRTVKLGMKIGVVWTFENIEAQDEQTAEAPAEVTETEETAAVETVETTETETTETEVDANLAIYRRERAGEYTYTPATDATFTIVTVDGQDYARTGSEIDHRIDWATTPLDATDKDGAPCKILLQSSGIIRHDGGHAYQDHHFVRTPHTAPFKLNHWEERAMQAGRMAGINGGIWDDM